MTHPFDRSGLAALSGAIVCGQPAAVPPSRALVNQYCAGCHNEKLTSGGFSWTKLDPDHPEQNADQAEKVIRKVRAGLMPPAGAPRPDAATLKAFAVGLETSIDRAAALHPPVRRRGITSILSPTTSIRSRWKNA